MIWLKFGGQTLHLLKLLGAIFGWAAGFKLAESVYLVFVEISKVKAAMANPELVAKFYGWSIDSASYAQGVQAYSFSSLQDYAGVMAGPVASVLFWMGALVVAMMVYRSSSVFLPVEEYENKMAEHHKKLIAHAVAHAKKGKK